MNHFENEHVVPTDEFGRPLPCSPLGDVGHGAAPVLTPQQITKLVQQHNQQQVLQQQQQFGAVVDDAASPESSIGPTTPPSTHSFASGVVAAYEQQSQIAQPQPQPQSHQQHASQQNSPVSPNQNFGADAMDQYQHHDASAAYQEAQSPQAHESQAQAQAQMMQLAQAQQQQQQQQIQMQMTPQGQIPYHQTAASHSQQQPYGLDDATSPMASGLATPALPSVPVIPGPNYAQRASQVPQIQTAMQQQHHQMTGAFNGFRSAMPASPPQDAFGMTSVVRRRTSPVSLGSPTSALSAHSSLSSLSMYSAASGALSRANSLSSIAAGPGGATLSSARGAIDEDDVMMDFDPLDDAPFISHASHPAHTHIASPVAMHPRRTISPAEQPQVCLPPALFSAPSPSPGIAGPRGGYFDDASGRSRSRGRGSGSTPASRAASPGGRTSGVVRTKSSKAASRDAASASGSGSGSGLGTNLLITGAAGEKQRLKAKLAVLDPLAIRERMGEAKEAKEPSSSSSSAAGGREGKSGRRSREKGYKCPIPGCTKSYLNPNGLKYHLNKGTCTIAPGAGSGLGLTASMPTTPAVSTPPSMVGTPMASPPASPVLEEQDALIAHTQQHLVSYQSQHSELQNALMPTY